MVTYLASSMVHCSRMVPTRYNEKEHLMAASKVPWSGAWKDKPKLDHSEKAMVPEILSVHETPLVAVIELDFVTVIVMDQVYEMANSKAIRMALMLLRNTHFGLWGHHSPEQRS